MEIEQIVGVEPMREKEYPLYYKVGVDGVTKIHYENNYLGDRSDPYCEIYKGDYVFATVMQRALAEIRYKRPAQEQED